MNKKLFKIAIYLILVIIFLVCLIKQYSPRVKAKIDTFITSIKIEHINVPKESIFKRLFNNEFVKTKNYLIYKKNNYTIYKSDLNGSNETLVYSGKNEIGSQLVDDIYVTDDWMIFQDIGGILRINLNTNKKERLFDGLVSNIQIKDNLIYFIYMEDNNRLYRMSINSEDLIRLSDDKWIEKFEIVDDKIYYNIANEAKKQEKITYEMNLNGSNKHIINTNLENF